MRKNFGVKPWTYPQPVFILAAYDEHGVPNAMNAAWGGISEENEISLCISAEHKTTENILARKAFTISMADAAHVTACDYVGIVSGNDVPDKVARAGFHTSKAAFVDAPLIDELPMAVECRLVSYDPETCRLVGQIVNVNAEESVLDASGNIDPDRFSPIIFDPSTTPTGSWETLSATRLKTAPCSSKIVTAIQTALSCLDGRIPFRNDRRQFPWVLICRNSMKSMATTWKWRPGKSSSGFSRDCWAGCRPGAIPFVPYMTPL